MYCIPMPSPSDQHGSEIFQLASQVRDTFGIPFETRHISSRKEFEKLRATLTMISVKEGLRIPQTVKNKRLYPHLLVCDHETPIAFFPQVRNLKDRKIEIRVEDYLRSLLSGYLTSLAPIPPLEDRIPRREQVDHELLKEGYLARAEMLRKIDREWTHAEFEWPD